MLAFAFLALSAAAIAEAGPKPAPSSPDKRLKPVKVFILAGQSNMEGQGFIKADPKRNGGKGSLEYLVKDPATADKFKHLLGKDGKWVVRDDVWIHYLDRKGKLTVGYGAKEDRIGPELGFGHVDRRRLRGTGSAHQAGLGRQESGQGLPPAEFGRRGRAVLQGDRRADEGRVERPEEGVPGVRRPRVRAGRVRLAPGVERPRQPGVQRRVREEPGQLHPRHPQGPRGEEPAVRDRRDRDERPGGETPAGAVPDESPGGRGRVRGVQGERGVRRDEGVLAGQGACRRPGRRTTGTPTPRPTT